MKVKAIMTTWFSEIFEANSDKARLIAIFISAIIAIIVLLLNQRFLDRRKRKELLIEKVEALYAATIEYESTTQEILRELYQRDRKKSYYPSDELINKLQEISQRMEMLIGLYFPQVPFERSKFLLGAMPVFEIAIKEKLVSEEESIIAHEETKDNIKGNVDEMKTSCRNLMVKLKH